MRQVRRTAEECSNATTRQSGFLRLRTGHSQLRIVPDKRLLGRPRSIARASGTGTLDSTTYVVLTTTFGKTTAIEIVLLQLNGLGAQPTADCLPGAI